MREGDAVSAVDKDLWEYFSSLYKNSNKGIKGRGKDRRISTIANSTAINSGNRRESVSSHTGDSEQADAYDGDGRVRDEETEGSESSIEGGDRDHGYRLPKLA